MNALAPEELFARGSVPMHGPVVWQTPIPENGSGVYVMALADPARVAIDHLDADQRGRWIGGQQIVYIGRARRLRRRLSQFYRHRYGARSPHRGGQSILLLDCAMLVYWSPASDFREAEHRMIEAFRAAVGAMPFANRVRSAQARRAPRERQDGWSERTRP
ncbi:MAG: hypothetical protein AB1749_14170 [Pseudomonadota bacterium]